MGKDLQGARAFTFTDGITDEVLQWIQDEKLQGNTQITYAIMFDDKLLCFGLLPVRLLSRVFKRLYEWYDRIKITENNSNS